VLVVYRLVLDGKLLGRGGKLSADLDHIDPGADETHRAGALSSTAPANLPLYPEGLGIVLPGTASTYSRPCSVRLRTYAAGTRRTRGRAARSSARCGKLVDTQ